MSVRIRMKKMGRCHQPFFRICAVDKRAPRDGRVLEELGTYDPRVPETDARAILVAERVDYWLSVGAQPSDNVAVLIKKYGTNGTHAAALRTGFQHAGGQIVVVQDADLEYDPKDIANLVQPIVEGRAAVVFGSWFHGPRQRVHLFWHRVANNSLTWLSNLLNNLDLSDMETGYMAFRKGILDRIRIRENGFGVEPELTAKVAKLKCRIYEVPVSYDGRTIPRRRRSAYATPFGRPGASSDTDSHTERPDRRH